MQATIQRAILLPGLMVISLAGAGCSALATPEPTPHPVKFELVSFTTEDDVEISGKLYQSGEIAVILTHMGTAGTTQESWASFAKMISSRGFTVLTFDFRGVGKSGGNGNQSYMHLDVLAAIDFLRQRGYEEIACMGASMGGTSCLKAATETTLAGLGVIASPMGIGYPNSVEPDEFANLNMPKLFTSAKDDRFRGLAAAVTKMYNISPEPKTLKIFPGTLHGTELFASEHKEEFTELLLDFLEELR